MSFVAIASGAEAALPRALADRFQLQPDDREGWCLAPACPSAEAAPALRKTTGERG